MATIDFRRLSRAFLLIAFIAGAARVASAADPAPAQALVDRAASAMRTDPEASRRDAEEALRVLAAVPDADLQVRAHLLLCDYFSERETATARSHVEAAEALLTKAHRSGLRSGVLDCQGQIAETAGDYHKARDLYEQAVDVATKTYDDEMLAGALFSRGYVLGLQGQYAAGLADLKRAQSLFERVELPNHALTALNSIAILYNRMGDYDEARHIYNRALKLQRQAGMRREEGVTLHNLGRASENLRDWTAAATAFDESYRISHELNYARGESYALRGLAAVASAKGDPRRALETLDRAAELQRQTPDARLAAQIDLVRGRALRQLHRLPESVATLTSARAVFEEADSLNELRSSYAELADTYAEMGEWRLAHEQLRKSQETAERIFKNQLDQRFATLKIEFDTAAKEKENALLLRENEANAKALEQERRARSLQTLVIILTVLLAALLATLAVHQWRSKRRMRTLAMTDELTGAPNRRSVLTRLGALLGQPDAAGCGMVIVDIDHFKSINDQHGHAEGDEALKVVAATLRALVHEPAFLGRLGGEEFVVVLPGAGIDGANAFAEEVRQKVMTIDIRRWLGDRTITISSGVTASAIGGTDTPSTMLQRADAALYEAKRAGRNCVRSTLPPEPVDAPLPETRENRETIKYA